MSGHHTCPLQKEELNIARQFFDGYEHYIRNNFDFPKLTITLKDSGEGQHYYHHGSFPSLIKFCSNMAFKLKNVAHDELSENFIGPKFLGRQNLICFDFWNSGNRFIYFLDFENPPEEVSFVCELKDLNKEMKLFLIKNKLAK